MLTDSSCSHAGNTLGIMRSIGDWMSRHDLAAYGCGPSEFVAPPDTR